jgi:outer membrane autotransporter protein
MSELFWLNDKQWAKLEPLLPPYSLGDVSPDTSLRFVGGSSFKTQAAPLARDAAVLGAGVDYLIGQQTTLGVAYIGQIGEHADTQAVRGNVSWRF